MRIVIAPKLLVVGLLLVGLIVAAQTSAQKVEKPALNPVLLGSDASGTLSFSYPRSCIGKGGAVVVGTHATIFESGQQQSAVVDFSTSGIGIMTKIAATNLTYPAALSSKDTFDSIGEFDLTPTGCVFTGSVGNGGAPCGSDAHSSNDTKLETIRTGFISAAHASAAHASAAHASAADPHSPKAVQGMYAAQFDERSAFTVVDTHTPVPGGPHTTLEQISLPSSDGKNNAFCGCSGAVYSGAFFRSNLEPIKKVADSLTLVPGLQLPLSYHNILSTSVSGNKVAFFGNFPSGLEPPRLFLGGLFVWDAQSDKIDTLEITLKNLTGFTAFGSPTISERTIGFVALCSEGESMRRSQLVDGLWSRSQSVAQAGQPIPGRPGVAFAQFPQPPSVCGGDLVFRAYTTDGETGIYRATQSGKLETLVDSTMSLGGRKVVYMGSGEHAYVCHGNTRALTFYASTVNTHDKDAYDGIYFLNLTQS